jgi:hypothetical protein
MQNFSNYGKVETPKNQFLKRTDSHHTTSQLQTNHSHKQFSLDSHEASLSSEVNFNETLLTATEQKNVNLTELLEKQTLNTNSDRHQYLEDLVNETKKLKSLKRETC